MGNVFKGTPTRGSVPSYGCISSSKECPTCRGTGVIQDGADASTGSGSEYIALIPLTDQRLRPQHITMKILLTVVLCLIISGLLIFFLLLRTVKLRSADTLLLPTAVQISDDIVSLNLSYPFNVTNWNYVPLYVESVDLMTLYHANLLNETMITLNQWIPARGTKELHVNQTLNFEGPEFSVYLPKMCQANNTYYNQIYISFRHEDLRRAFSRYGPIAEVTIPTDYYSGRMKGFAFVEFEDPRDATYAQRSMDQTRFMGRRIEVEFTRGYRKTPAEMRDRALRSGRHRSRSTSRRYSRRSRSTDRSRSVSPRNSSSSKRNRNNGDANSRDRRSSGEDRHRRHKSTKSLTPRSRSPT